MGVGSSTAGVPIVGLQIANIFQYHFHTPRGAWVYSYGQMDVDIPSPHISGKTQYKHLLKDSCRLWTQPVNATSSSLGLRLDVASTG